MGQRQRLTIHVRGEQDRIALRLVERQAAGKGDRSRRLRFVVDLPFVGPFEHNFDRVVLQTGFVEDGGQRDAAPLCITDRAEAPLQTLHGRRKKDTPVAGTLERRGQVAIGQLQQFVERQFQFVVHRAFNG